MNTRALEPSDYGRIKKIHEKYYAHEFALADFFKDFLCAFVVENDLGEIITAGGVRTIAEVVLITNKDMSTRSRAAALYEALMVSASLSKNNGFDELHAFVQDKSWERVLMKKGFIPTKGNALVIGVK